MMSERKPGVWWLLASLVVSHMTSCQGFDVTELDAMLKDSFTCHPQNPGLAVTVVQGSKVIFTKGYGFTDMTSPRPVTPDTVFGVASLSKGFAATLLLKLLNEKTNLTADSSVSALHQFNMQDPYRSSQMTFADLLSHRTALTPNNKLRFDNNLTRSNIIERIGLLPTPDQFRVKYYYNNLMYGAVTSLTEKLGGAKWEELVQRHLYTPLNMTKSGFATTIDFGRPDVATAYETDLFNTSQFKVVSPEFSRRWAELGGSGSVMSTARDMGRWMGLHLSDGQGVVPLEVLENVHKGRFLVTSSRSRDTEVPWWPVTASENVYGGGFKSGFYRGYSRLSHTGTTLGYRSMMSLLPHENVGVFIVMTGPDDNYAYRVSLQFLLLDFALGLQPWINATTLCTYPSPWVPPKPGPPPPNIDPNRKPAHDIQLYTGRYYNKAYGNINVIEEGQSLMMVYGWGKWKLVATGGDKFYGQGQGITDIFDVSHVTFDLDPSGVRVVSLTPVTFNSHLPPVFDKTPSDFDIVG